AVALGESGQVEPVPRPALAEMLVVEKPVDQPFISIRRRIVDKRTDFFRTRRQTDQIKINAPDEALFADGRIWRDPGRFELGQDESIDGRPAAILFFDAGFGRVLERWDRPEF